MEKLNDLLSLLDKIEGLPAAALVCFSCIVIGYLFKAIKPFPNSAIPVVVILWGALAMLFLADARPTTMSPRIWTARNFTVGLIIGAIAWQLHFWVLSYVDNWIRNLVPGSKNIVDTPAPAPETPKEITKTP